MDPAQIADRLADKFENLAALVPEEDAQEKVASDTYVDPSHTLAFLKFFAS